MTENIGNSFVQGKVITCIYLVFSSGVNVLDFSLETIHHHFLE